MGVTGFALSQQPRLGYGTAWGGGAGRTPYRREAAVQGQARVLLRAPCFGDLFFNLFTKCNPFAWTAEDTCRARLVVFQVKDTVFPS